MEIVWSQDLPLVYETRYDGTLVPVVDSARPKRPRLGYVARYNGMKPVRLKDNAGRVLFEYGNPIFTKSDMVSLDSLAAITIQENRIPSDFVARKIVTRTEPLCYSVQPDGSLEPLSDDRSYKKVVALEYQPTVFGNFLPVPKRKANSDVVYEFEKHIFSRRVRKSI